MTTTTSGATSGLERFSVTSAADGLNALSTIEHLLKLDDVWTGYLTAVGGPDFDGGGIDFDGLLYLAGQMDESISRTTEAAKQVEQLLEPLSNDAIVAGLVAIARDLPADSTGVIDWLVGDLGGISARGFLIASCEYVLREREAEQGVLSEKISHLEAREVPDADLRHPFRCALCLVGIGAAAALGAAALVSTLGVAAVVGLGAASAASQTILNWDKTGCGRGDARAAIAPA